MDQLLDATARAEREHFWFRGFRRFVAPLLARAVAGRTSPRILDCGCGTGNNLRLLREYGRPCGIDLTLSGLAYAKRQGERLVAQASALSLPFSDDAFDLVTSFDVIYAFDDEMSGNGLEGDVPGAAAWRGAGAERRGAAGASRQPLDSRRRSAALHPLRPAPSSRAGGILGAAPHLYEFRDSSHGRGRAFLAASAAGAPRAVGQRDDRPGAACQPDARRPADTGVIRAAGREHAAR